MERLRDFKVVIL